MREESENHKADVVTSPSLWQDKARPEVCNHRPPLNSDKPHEPVWPREWISKVYNLLRFKCLHYFYCKFLWNLLSTSYVCVICMCVYVVVPTMPVCEGGRLTLGIFLCHSCVLTESITEPGTHQFGKLGCSLSFQGLPLSTFTIAGAIRWTHPRLPFMWMLGLNLSSWVFSKHFTCCAISQPCAEAIFKATLQTPV